MYLQYQCFRVKGIVGIAASILLSLLPMGFLPQLLHFMAALSIEFLSLLVPGGFNLTPCEAKSKVAQRFVASMATMDLSQVIDGLTYGGLMWIF